MTKLEKHIIKAETTLAEVDSSSPEFMHQLGVIEGLHHTNVMHKLNGLNTSGILLQELRELTHNDPLTNGIFDGILQGAKILIDNKYR